MHKKIYLLAQEAKQKAYAPYSHFQVGACIETEDYQYFVGCNVENVSYGMTLCAEAVAMGNMVSHGSTKIRAIAIVTDADEYCPPCGACRQRLMEFSTPETIIHLFNKKGGHQTLSMLDLFPFPFDKTFLG